MYGIKAKHISNFRPITTESSTMQLYRSTQSHQRPVKQSKIASQRQYRVKEGDGFQELRDVIRSMTGEAPQTRREILTKAAELLKQISKENETSSRHEPLPALEIPSAPLYESNQHPHTSYEPLILPNNEAWKNASATWTRNNSPMSDMSATSSVPECHSHSHAEVHHDHVITGSCGGNWNLVQPTPSQFRQYSFPPQWDDLSLIHSSVDHVPFYVERVGMN